MRCEKGGNIIDDNARNYPICKEEHLPMPLRKPGGKPFREKVCASIRMILERFFAYLNRLHFVKFIRYQYEEKHIVTLIFNTFPIFLFLAFGILLIIFSICTGIAAVFSGGSFCYGDEVIYCRDIFNGIGSGIVCFLCAFAILLLKNHQLNSGQKTLRKTLDAYEIEREEHIDQYKVPTERIIEIARSEGMKLPETINIYLVNSEYPQIYAIGMNTIILSTGMDNIKEDMFEAMVRTELYKIEHMYPDYMLLIYEGSFVVLAISFFVLLFTGITMKYGDHRKRLFGLSESVEAAYYHYLTIAVAIIWIGLMYKLFMRGVKKDILKADQYVASCGFGEAQCSYIDNFRQQDFRGELLQIGYPSPDKRIAALQAAGVNYYRV